MTDYIQVMTTFESQIDAESLAASLLTAGLAACVQVQGPVSSLYQWKGETVRAQEYVCLIKSRRCLYEELEKEIRAQHPYEVPEILALPILLGDEEYLNWLDGELKGSSER